jgi:hypothetical protein
VLPNRNCSAKRNKDQKALARPRQTGRNVSPVPLEHSLRKCLMETGFHPSRKVVTSTGSPQVAGQQQLWLCRSDSQQGALVPWQTQEARRTTRVSLSDDSTHGSSHIGGPKKGAPVTNPVFVPVPPRQRTWHRGGPNSSPSLWFAAWLFALFPPRTKELAVIGAPRV